MVVSRCILLVFDEEWGDCYCKLVLTVIGRRGSGCSYDCLTPYCLTPWSRLLVHLPFSTGSEGRPCRSRPTIEMLRRRVERFPGPVEHQEVRVATDVRGPRVPRLWTWTEGEPTHCSVVRNDTFVAQLYADFISLRPFTYKDTTKFVYEETRVKRQSLDILNIVEMTHLSFPSTLN